MRSLHSYFVIKIVFFDSFPHCIFANDECRHVADTNHFTSEMSLTTFSNVSRPKPYLYKNDHRYPGANKTDVPVVILYAEIGTKKFMSFHKVLSEKAGEGTLIYVLRHFVAVSSNALAAISK